MFSQHTDKEFDIELNIGVNEKNNLDGKVRLLAKANNGTVNIKSISIELKKEQETIGEKKQFKLKLFSNRSLYLATLTPKSLAIADRLTILIELNTGESIHTNWPIEFKSAQHKH